MVRAQCLFFAISRSLAFFAIINVMLGAARTPASGTTAATEQTGLHRLLLTSSPFEEPLIPTCATSHKEDESLLQAIKAYEKQARVDDFRAFDVFLSDYPRSGWRVALLTNLGLSYYHYGYFSRAIDSWERAWQAGRIITEPRAKALVDRAFGELMRMHARLGHAEQLEALFKDMGDRHVTGPATEAVDGAKQGLWVMKHEPGVAYLCGPMALKNLLLSQNYRPDRLQLIENYRSGRQGVTLAQVSDLAREARVSHRLIFRSRNQPVPVPSLIHWKVSHFAAVLGEENGRFHVKDPTFGQDDLWITRAALESESSGYFLLLGTSDNTGWREVSLAEAAQVRGMGYTTSSDPTATTPCDPTVHGGCHCGKGLTEYDFTEMLVSLRLTDTPVGYTPPKGPDLHLTLSYNQREANQPANFKFFNISPKWTFNWLTYIQDDPTQPGANVMRQVAGGGSVNYFFNSGTGVFAAEARDGSVLTRIEPILPSNQNYRRQLSDGTVETYANADLATTYPRNVFLSAITDPAGNTVRLVYETVDRQIRLTSIVDATGRETTFSYELPNDPLLVTRITDPFRRNAKLDYDTNGRLRQITDVLGLTSQFTYDSSSLISAMTTPYGTTTFSYGENGITRFLQATDPLGNTERLEFLHHAPGIPFSDPDNLVPKGMIAPLNQLLDARDTYYWDKHAYQVAKGDYTKSRNKHWTHLLNTNYLVTGHTVESIKYPFENRIWYNYPGQNVDNFGTAVSGTLDKKTRIGRVLDDGTTQLTQLTYNAVGNVTDMADPLGRETQFVYETNGIDRLQEKQKTSGAGYSTTAEFTYNAQHRPLTYKDAAGQTTSYAYNAAGQLTQITNPLNEVTGYEYDGLGYLTRIVNPNTKTRTSFTYDPFGRVATRTDSEGYELSFAYDALDRVIKETFPDGTTREYTWDKLDLALVKDREGKVTQYTHDAVRNLTEVTDPLKHQTKLGYYENGSLKSLTDANNNITAWSIDVQDRVTAKQYADGRQVVNTYEVTTSRLKAITDALKQVEQYNYNADDSLVSISYAQAINPTPNVSFTYDPYFPRMVSMTDGSGTSKYSYQAVGSLGALQPAQETGPYQNTTITYQYDALGRLSGRTVDTSAETFNYDKLSRVASHSSALGTFDLGYLGQTDQLTSQRLRGGLVGTDWAYDSNTNDHRLKAITNSGATRSFQYTTMPENLISRITETANLGSAFPAQTWDYSYDESRRLLQGRSSIGTQYSYGYDSADNIASLAGPAGSEAASYNALNQITEFGNRAFLYDGNGNLMDDGVRTYQWDAENRLISVRLQAQPGQTTTFRYDGLGRRTAIIANGLETRYLWCGNTLCQARTGANAVSRRYYSEGELIPAAGTSLYYAQDQLGSVRSVLAAQNGSNVASYDYDPYGNPSRTSGRISTDFRFAGMFYDQGSGLYLTYHRVYDPRSGRWLSRDPLETAEFREGPNLYSYVLNDPINRIDHLGLLAIPGNGWGEGGTRAEALAAAQANCAASCPPGSTVKHNPDVVYETPHSRGGKLWACSSKCSCGSSDAGVC